MLVREIIAESELPKALLARDAQLSPDALNSWIAERRVPQPESLHQLAEGLRKRAARLAELADQLDKAA
jgi:hypothetical protein